jgi:O-antigen/teichoic acid export membrane protein
MDKKFKKNFLKGSAAATAGTIVSMLFHFISILFLTRALTKEEFGTYALIIVIVALFNVLSGLGLDITAVKYLAGSSDEERKRKFSSILVMRVVQIALVTLIFLTFGSLLLSLFDGGLNQFLYLFPLLFILTSFRDLFYNVLQGLNYFKKFASVQISSAVIRVSLIILLVQLDMLTINNLIFIELSTTGLALLVQIFHIPFKQLITGLQSFSTFKEIIQFSFPLYINVLLTFAYDRVNLLIIAAFLTPVSVAFYDVANKVPEALKRVFHSFIIVFFPNISKLFSEGKIEEAKLLMNKSLKVLAIGISIILGGAFTFRNEVMLIMFSESYVEASLAFALLMLNFALRSISNVLGYSLVSAGHSKAPVKVNSIASVVSLLGSIALVPAIGYMGAIFAGIAMNTVSQFLYTIHLNRNKIETSKQYFKPYLIMLPLILITIIFNIESILLKISLFVTFSIIVVSLMDESRKYICKYVPGFRQF